MFIRPCSKGAVCDGCWPWIGKKNKEKQKLPHFSLPLCLSLATNHRLKAHFVENGFVHVSKYFHQQFSMCLKETTYLFPLAMWVTYTVILQACTSLWTHLATKTCHSMDFYITEWPPYKILAMPLSLINACIHMWLLYFLECISLRKQLTFSSTTNGFPCEMTAEEQSQKFHNGDMSQLLRSGLCFWPVEAKCQLFFQAIDVKATLQKCGFRKQ